MSIDELEMERHAGVVWVRMRRGERNLLDAGLTRSLADTVTELSNDPTVAVLVLTGAGVAFCGGADGAALRETGSAQVFADAAVDLFVGLAEAPFPVIAALNGDALAGGFGLACAADIVICVETAAVGTVEASLGTWPMIAQVPASRRVPPKAALRNALTGVPFTAQEALGLGIVDEVLPNQESVLSRARELAQEIGRGNRAIAMGRPALVGLLSRASYRAELNRCAQGFVELFSS